MERGNSIEKKRPCMPKIPQSILGEGLPRALAGELGDARDEFDRGGFCARIFRVLAATEKPKRVFFPMRRGIRFVFPRARGKAPPVSSVGMGYRM